ncbi:DNA glycosylase, partial [Coniochaeta sp. PMI_546]
VVDPSDKSMADFRKKTKRGTANKYGLTRGYSPYPYRTVPTKEQCEEVHRILVETHGMVTQPTNAPPPSLEVAGCGEVPAVLDGLCRTLISGNTLMAHADKAIVKLAETYGVLKHGVGAGSIDWNAVWLEPKEKLVDAIRIAGCSDRKAGHIKAILEMVHKEQEARALAHMMALEVQKAVDDYLSLEHVRAMTADEALTEFLRFPGIGVKTAACVVLFTLRFPCFAVDTHVHKFCKWLGWVPEKASDIDAFNHGEHMVPDHLKYALHQLFIRHGQDCFKCRKNTKPGSDGWNEAPDCPLEHLLDRNK